MRRTTRLLLATPLALSLLVGLTTHASASDAPWAGDPRTFQTVGGAMPAGCLQGTRAQARASAERLMEHRYALKPPKFPEVRLPADLGWNEDPLDDPVWRKRLHELRYVPDLLWSWLDTGGVRYRDRALALLRDWYEDNPRSAPADPGASWADQTTAFRAIVYVCASTVLPGKQWLVDAIDLHGRTLALDSFYNGYGNHALNQNRGLLDVGCFRGRADWIDLAVERTAELIRESVDAQGVTNEQSLGYQLYNWLQYTDMAERMRACGRAPPALFERLTRMPDLLAHGTLPNGEYELIGDTNRRRALAIEGTIAEHAATLGASGPRPDDTIATFDRGWAFARNGWGPPGESAHRRHLSVRWGPGARGHGHADGTAMTLYGFGSRLLLDSGPDTFPAGDTWEHHFTSRSAHNVVVVNGAAWDHRQPTVLDARLSSGGLDAFRLRHLGYEGVVDRRTIVFPPSLRWVIVDDRLSASRSLSYEQLWHLPADAAPSKDGRTVRTRRDGANLVIRQLLPVNGTSIVTGRYDPPLGWLSVGYRDRISAPVAVSRLSGTDARFLTLLVPAARSSVEVATSDLTLTADGFVVTLAVAGVRERVTVEGSTLSREPLD